MSVEDEQGLKFFLCLVWSVNLLTLSKIYLAVWLIQALGQSEYVCLKIYKHLLHTSSSLPYYMLHFTAAHFPKRSCVPVETTGYKGKSVSEKAKVFLSVKETCVGTTKYRLVNHTLHPRNGASDCVCLCSTVEESSFSLWERLVCSFFLSQLSSLPVCLTQQWME